MPIKIAVGLPAYRSIIDVGQANMWIDFGMEVAKDDRFEFIYLEHIDACGVEKARNRLVRSALDDKIDWLLMLDSDNFVVPTRDTAPGKALLEMFDAGYEGDVLGTSSRARAVAIGAPCLSRDGAKTNARNYIANDWRMLQLRDLQGEVTKVDRLGTGLMAINLNWLRDNWPDPPWFQCVYEPGTMKFVGEDDYFCDQVKEKGGVILCDGRVALMHADRRTQ